MFTTIKAVAGRWSAVVAAALLVFTVGCGGSEQKEPEVKRPEGPPRVIPDPLGPHGMDPAAGVEGPITKYTNATRSHYAHPDVSLDGHWLAYSATIGGPNPHIYVQRKGGYAARQLTQGSSSNIQPAISPNGHEVAFASNADGHNYFVIYRMSMNGQGGRSPISPDGHSAISPTWSHDGSKVAFAACRNPDSDHPVWKIMVHDIHAHTTMTLREGTMPSWSPDGSRIVFQRSNRNKPGYTSIWTMRPDGSEMTEVYRSDDHGAITPSWLGSEWILFATVNKSLASRTRNNDAMFNADDIWMVNKNGTQARMVTAHRMADWDPTFDLANNEILYVSNRDGVQNIFGIKSNVSNPWGIASNEMRAGGR